MSAVRRNSALSRFELDVEGETAFLTYRIAGGEILMNHTETPYALRGRRIGEKLVLGALEEAQADGLKVRPLCSFVRHVLSQHLEFGGLVA
jgi:predicted GNAT family acetyltransferase